MGRSNTGGESGKDEDKSGGTHIDLEVVKRVWVVWLYVGGA